MSGGDPVWSTEWHSDDKLAYAEVRVYSADPPYPPMIRVVTDEDLYVTGDDAEALAWKLLDAAQIASEEAYARERPPRSYLSKVKGVFRG